MLVAGSRIDPAVAGATLAKRTGVSHTSVLWKKSFHTTTIFHTEKKLTLLSPQTEQLVKTPEISHFLEAKKRRI